MMEWYGYTTKHQIEVVAIWVESLIQQIPFETLMNDCSALISVWDDSIDWFSQVWLLRMRRLGVSGFIHIAKPNSFGERIGRYLWMRKHPEMEFLFFSTKQEVAAWLKLHDKEDNISVD
ncbi:hypothetical protein I0P70_18485 [Pontibacter sp. FD36]|uniref:hypothetical protein n=1 Tax=Pontibacter sp. FD36 TaxID=2789860 RepID=UPI0018AA4575|nr:hypothetical protein [Pontibacter sp. FD36]MBF8965242.1 hypothetical protein [Pontibacter sp. FD36]